MKTKSKSTQSKLGKNMLIMDVNAIPRYHGMDTKIWSKIVREEGIVFYDSNGGEKPSFMNVDQSIKVFDVKEEESMAELEKILLDDEYIPKPVEPAPVEPVAVSETMRGVFTEAFASNGTTYVGGNDAVITTTGGEIFLDTSGTVSNISPLTSQEIDQLEITDPNPATQSSLSSESEELTEQEASIIDRQMARISINGANFDLTDDTED
jgi:hypothetical protein